MLPEICLQKLMQTAILYLQGILLSEEVHSLNVPNVIIRIEISFT